MEEVKLVEEDAQARTSREVKVMVMSIPVAVGASMLLPTSWADILLLAAGGVIVVIAAGMAAVHIHDKIFAVEEGIE